MNAVCLAEYSPRKMTTLTSAKMLSSYEEKISTAWKRASTFAERDATVM
jgi:hypothetical protein